MRFQSSLDIYPSRSHVLQREVLNRGDQPERRDPRGRYRHPPAQRGRAYLAQIFASLGRSYALVSIIVARSCFDYTSC